MHRYSALKFKTLMHEINRIAILVPCKFITKNFACILHFYNNFVFSFPTFLPYTIARLQWTTHSTAHSNTILHISDGGQRNIEDSIHHAVPIMGISYSSTLEHYLYQIEKFDCGIISYVDYDNQRVFESKIDDLLNSLRWVIFVAVNKKIINKRHDLSSKQREWVSSLSSEMFMKCLNLLLWQSFVILTLQVMETRAQ